MKNTKKLEKQGRAHHVFPSIQDLVALGETEFRQTQNQCPHLLDISKMHFYIVDIAG